MEEINLHFTGDFHAIAAAHNLLSALIDNHLAQGNALNLDTRRITWPRTIDMNDRALRHATIGLGGVSNGVPREARWVIVPASEVMAIIALSIDYTDLQDRLGRIVVGTRNDTEKTPIRARDLNAQGAMAALLKHALKPNLVQTLEGGPAILHAGPFGNIAHGCNSIIATRMGLALADVVVTEAGFGSDLGAEKFFDIVCPVAGIAPQVAVLVATVRSLKMQGGVPVSDLDREQLDALECGLPHLAHHVANVQQFGVPVVVALNRRHSDTDAEINRVMAWCAEHDVHAVCATVFSEGGEGGVGLARAVRDLLSTEPGAHAGSQPQQPLYAYTAPTRDKVAAIAQRVYGARDVVFAGNTSTQLRWLETHGYDEFPVCMAKTQYSLTDDPKRLGVPRNFSITITDITVSAGAGFLVARCGDIMTMPGLPKTPAAERIQMNADGQIDGLS
jgi:formate--tetrahydrofolate ligase